MADRFTSGDQPDDPLALFGDESAPKKKAAKNTGPVKDTFLREARPRGGTASPPETPANIAYPTATDFKRITASVSPPTGLDSNDLEVEVIGPPPPTGSVSFDHICAVKGLGFVEGVALVQAAAEAVDDSASGVPELHGLFLTRAGEVVLHGPPTGEPPARELARLLHQLVAPSLMPPAGRLFIGRWINNDAGDLREFVSELAYFARPNGQELLLAVHGRCDGVRASVTETQPPPRPRRARPVAPPEPAAEKKPTPPLLGWFALHKRELTIAAAVIGVAATLTAAATLLWAPGTVEASKALPPINSLSESETGEKTEPPKSPSARRPASSATNAKNGGSGRSTTPSRSRAAVTPLARRGGNDQAPPSAIASQDASVTVPVTPAALPARTVPDLKIYTANDAGVEPPVLRSAEIPELLIAGFEKRTNEVELVISETGEVQQARMVKAPQRMPDIMLLSRAKELLFNPATRNGVPVRYKLLLSWNVTP